VVRVWDDGLLRLGACSWTAKGWEKTFYQRAKRSTDFLGEYAERFSTVEIDASFYACPRVETVRNWRAVTPSGFIFSAKIPRIITHDKFLVDCEGELHQFLDTMEQLGEKLGPILFQFPYFAQAKGVSLGHFQERLRDFLPRLPRGQFQFALEVRNKAWVCGELLDTLRAHNIALALIDHPWMAGCEQLFRQDGLVTGPFVYIRWLGDRKGIEKITTVWDKSVVERTRDLARWVPPIKRLIDQQVRVYGYVNNHYSGHAPADLVHLAEALDAPIRGPRELPLL
jgi:uncharacterized protein YecE (DUF72 family)